MIDRLLNYFSGRDLTDPIEEGTLGAVVVDMQPNFLKYISRNDQYRLFASQLRVLKICAERDYPIAVLEYAGCDLTSKSIIEITEKAPRYDFFIRNDDDGFYEIEEQLEQWGVNNLCFMGINAASCVKATAMSAKLKGKNIITARELIANPEFKQEEFEESISWFKRNGIYFPKYVGLVNKITS